MVLRKSYPAYFKTIKGEDGLPTGELEAIVSVFGNVDLMGDRVVPGAFLDDLKAWQASGDPIPMVWSHSWDNPMNHIGTWDARKSSEVAETDTTPAGLLLVGQTDIGTGNPVADQVYKLVAQRRVKEFSFAYRVDDEREAEDGANELKALTIIEAGPTLKGANPDTVMVAAKAMGTADAEVAAQKAVKSFEERLAALENRMKGLTVAPDSDKKATTPDMSDIQARMRLLDL